MSEFIFTVKEGKGEQTYEGFQAFTGQSPPPGAKFLCIASFSGDMEFWYLESKEATEELQRYYRMLHGQDVSLKLYQEI